MRHLTTREMGLLVRQARKDARSGDWEALRDLLLVEIAASTGCRKKEALGLMVDDLDFVENSIYFRPNDRRPLKTRAAKRRLPMTASVSGAAKRFLPHCTKWALPHKGGDGPWFEGRPGHKPLDRVKALGRRAGVPHVTLLKIRHGFATTMEQHSSELLRQRFLGHRKAKTQYGYGHEDLEQLREVSKLIRYD